jgi:hypothetical protein
VPPLPPIRPQRARSSSPPFLILLSPISYSHPITLLVSIHSWRWACRILYSVTLSAILCSWASSSIILSQSNLSFPSRRPRPSFSKFRPFPPRFRPLISRPPRHLLLQQRPHIWRLAFHHHWPHPPHQLDPRPPRRREGTSASMDKERFQFFPILPESEVCFSNPTVVRTPR